MGSFEKKKKEIMEAAAANNKDGKTRVTHNTQQFNELATALLNDPDYVDTTRVTKDGKTSSVDSTPIAPLRKAMIGSVASAAGLDQAEVEKIVANHQFPTLPMYPYVSTLLEGYLDAGKAFTFERRGDLECTLKMNHEEETVKESRRPATDIKSTSKYGAYRRIKSTSKCPKELRTKVD